MLWTLWTGKEAAYKVVRKGKPDVPSIPRFYNVSLGEINSTLEDISSLNGKAFYGVVDTPAGTVSLYTVITNDYVHSIGVSFSFYDVLQGRVVSDVEKLFSPEPDASTDESLHVRNAAKGRLSRCFKINPDIIEIKRDGGIRGLEPPHVYFQGQPAPIDISLSHSGAFIAYAFSLPS